MHYLCGSFVVAVTGCPTFLPLCEMVRLPAGRGSFFLAKLLQAFFVLRLRPQSGLTRITKRVMLLLIRPLSVANATDSSAQVLRENTHGLTRNRSKVEGICCCVCMVSSIAIQRICGEIGFTSRHIHPSKSAFLIHFFANY